MNSENSHKVVIICGVKGEGKISHGELMKKIANGELQVIDDTNLGFPERNLPSVKTAEMLASEIYKDIDFSEPKRTEKPRHPAEKGMRKQWWNDR